MKKLIVSLSLVVMMAASALAASADVVVKGMVCSFCAQGLVKKFGAKPEVEDVKVTLSDKTMRLVFKEGENLTDEQIEKTVKDSGFELEGIKRN